MTSTVITDQVALDKQVLCDVLTNGVESGGHAMWYWDGFVMVNIDRDADLNVESVTFDADDTNNPERVMRYMIRWDDLAHAVEEVLQPHSKHPLRDDLVNQVRTMLNPDDADTDAEVADCLIQIAAFGEVVYS